ncbi:unnamed protein product [marine sediment metagenome]|uniref:Uncharacterized protein n=1 Tax=marine sediment metagenome TaxID=412755 RepID=X1FGV5_9ZZZZ
MSVQITPIIGSTTKMDRPICPKCQWKMYYRKNLYGYVCANVQCPNYWNDGEGLLIKSKMVTYGG